MRGSARPSVTSSGGDVRDGGHQLVALLLVGAGLHGAGQPEVGDLDDAVDQVGDAAAGRLGDQHVLRLDVAVHQAGPVGGGDRGEHLLDDRQRLVGVEPAALDEHVAQRAAADVLHHQVRQAVVGALVVDRDHVGVGQPGDRLGLVGEPGRGSWPLGLRRLRRLGRVNDLDGDGALEALVGGGVHGRHATTGDATANAVAPVDQRAQQRVGDLCVHRQGVYVSRRQGQNRMLQPVRRAVLPQPPVSELRAAGLTWAVGPGGTRHGRVVG